MPQQAINDKKEECIKELAEWFARTRRPMRAKDMRPLAEKYFTGEELTEFYKFVDTTEGRELFKKHLRAKAWELGLAPKEESPAKELWEMTLEQYALEKGARPAWVKAGYGETYRTHKRAVERAISEGKPVPPEVLADYPHLLKESAGAEKKFPLGQIVMTRGVNDLVAESAGFAKFVTESLRRHARGDWGDLTEEDKKENEYALGRYLRLFSAYIKPPLRKIWIITEADRSATTILFPEEY